MAKNVSVMKYRNLFEMKCKEIGWKTLVLLCCCFFSFLFSDRQFNNTKHLFWNKTKISDLGLCDEINFRFVSIIKFQHAKGLCSNYRNNIGNSNTQLEHFCFCSHSEISARYTTHTQYGIILWGIWPAEKIWDVDLLYVIFYQPSVWL